MTKQEIEYAKAFIVLGFKYISKDNYDFISVHNCKPVISGSGWYWDSNEVELCGTVLFPSIYTGSLHKLSDLVALEDC